MCNNKFIYYTTNLWFYREVVIRYRVRYCIFLIFCIASLELAVFCCLSCFYHLSVIPSLYSWYNLNYSDLLFRILGIAVSVKSNGDRLGVITLLFSSLVDIAYVPIFLLVCGDYVGGVSLYLCRVSCW